MKNKLLKTPFFLLVLCVSFNFSCIKNLGKNTLNTTSSTTGVVSECDTITYNKHIKFLMDQYCGSNPQCHTNGVSNGGVTLDTYDETKYKASKIKMTIFDAQPIPMPPTNSAQLTQNQKKQINCWLSNGLKN